MKDTYNVLIVGATGLVGKTLIEILIEKNFPFKEIKGTKGHTYTKDKLFVKNQKINIYELNENIFDDIDFCFFCSTNEVSRAYGKIAKRKCKYVIDNSSYYRMNNDVPLIVPSVNFSSINSSFISNPNCSTIQAVLVINEIKKLYKIKRIIYSTYQSCSGGGKEELIELKNSFLNKNKKYSNLLCDTCISQIGEINNQGYSTEELKMINETKKIFKDDKIYVHANCIRVPVKFCHGVFIYLECDKKINKEVIIDQLKKSDRLEYIEDNEILFFQDAYQKDKVLVGRVREDIDNECALSLFCVADNLRIGAALNAYEILERLMNDDKN